LSENIALHATESEQQIDQMDKEYSAVLAAEKTLQGILDDVIKEHRDAQKQSSKEKIRISRMTASAIKVFSDSLRKDISDVIEAAHTSAGTLHTTCQRLVIQLDTKASLLYVAGMNAALLSNLHKEIRSLNESSDITVDFTGQLNDIAMGHMGVIRFTPSQDALRAEARWELLAAEAENVHIKQDLLRKYDIPEAQWNRFETYKNAVQLLNDADDTVTIRQVTQTLVSLDGYRDSALYIKKSEEKLAVCEKREAEKTAAAQKEKAAKEAAIAAEKQEIADKKQANRKKVQDVIDQTKQSLSEEKKTTERDNAADKARIDAATAERTALGFFAFAEKKALAVEIKQLQRNITERNDAYQRSVQQKTAKLEKAKQILTCLSGIRGREVSLGTQYHSNGTKPMQWLIVGIEDNAVLLLAKHTVDARRPFDLDKTDFNSNNNHRWLSQIFPDKVFTAIEQTALKTIPRDGVRAVFLPTKNDVQRVGGSFETTPEEAFSGANLPYYNKFNACQYWLGGFNYSGTLTRDVEYVDFSGNIRTAHGNSFSPYGVRPMICMDLEKLCNLL